MRRGDFKEVSAWGKVHGYGHGSWTRHSKITAKTCLYLLLACQLVRLLLEAAAGQLKRHLVSRFHIVVHSFLCGLFAPALRCRWRTFPISRLTSHGSRLTFRCSQLPARGGSCSLKAAAVDTQFVLLCRSTTSGRSRRHLTAMVSTSMPCVRSLSQSVLIRHSDTRALSTMANTLSSLLSMLRRRWRSKMRLSDCLLQLSRVSNQRYRHRPCKSRPWSAMPSSGWCCFSISSQ